MKKPMEVSATYYGQGFSLYIGQVVYGIDDKIEYKEAGSDKVKTVKLYYDDMGDSYFKAGKCRIPLNECIRVNL